MRLCVWYTRRLRPQPIIRSLFDRRSPRPRLTPQRLYNNKIYNIILYMWSASAVWRPGRAFAPEQVHRQSARPSVCHTRREMTPSPRNIYFRRPLLYYRVRIYGAYIVRVFFFSPGKSNKTRPVVERWGAVRSESLEKSFVTNFERDQLLLPTLCTQRRQRTIWKFHWPGRDSRVQWTKKSSSQPAHRVQQLRRFNIPGIVARVLR